MGAVNC